MLSIKKYKLFLLFVFCGLLWFLGRLLFGGRIVLPDARTIGVYLILAPFAEELFFRGVLQKSLKKWFIQSFHGLTSANVIVSIVFSMSHYFTWGAEHAALVFIPSLIFGYLFDRTDRIYLSWYLHTIYNVNIFIS